MGVVDSGYLQASGARSQPSPRVFSTSNCRHFAPRAAPRAPLTPLSKTPDSLSFTRLNALLGGTVGSSSRSSRRPVYIPSLADGVQDRRVGCGGLSVAVGRLS